MFDLAGLRAMGESIETFTTNSANQLAAIERQLRITNCLAAIDIADQRAYADRMGRPSDPIDVLTEATTLAMSENPDGK